MGDPLVTRKTVARIAVLLAVLTTFPAMLLGQDAASMTGTVTDSTSAVVPNATVMLRNTTTSASYTMTTNGRGSYTFANVTPGPGYEVTFSKTGFEPVVVKGIYLTVDNTRTQNAQLRAGNVSASVEVVGVGREVTLNTTDATIGNNYDAQLVNDLPVQNRDSPAALFTLQPGITLDGSTTGARQDQNYVTLDGMDVNDFAAGSPFAVIAKAPVDSVEEFRGTTAGFLSSSGPGGGAQFSLVTKSGTNAFHGNLNEYHRDTNLTANSYFNKIAGIARPPLVRNQFGGAIGGPVLRDRLFFFFDFNQSRIAQNTQVARTVPLDSYRNGNVSYINNSINPATGVACPAGSRQNTTPTCIGTLTTAQVKALDPAGIGVNASFLPFINSRYPHVNDVTGGDGVNSGLYRFNAPNPDYETNYVGRIDYTLKSNMRLFGRFSIVREDSTQSPIQFPGDPVTSPFIDRSTGWSVGHTWTIGGRMVNNVYGGETVADLAFPNTYNPQGTSLMTFGVVNSAALFSDPYRSPSNAQFRVVPTPLIGDDFSWQKGSHNLQVGGTFKWITAHLNTKIDYNTFTIGAGGRNSTLIPSLRPTDIRAGSTAIYDNSYMAMLGRVASIVSYYNFDNTGTPLPYATGDDRRYKYYQSLFYIADTWKATHDLTLSYGINYQIFSVPYETRGLESVENFTFNQYFGARMAQSVASASGASAVPFITYSLGGLVNHGPDLYAPSYNNVAPRFAFAYNPSFARKTVINGGVGVVFDRTVTTALLNWQDKSNYLFQSSSSYLNGVTGDPVTALKNDPRVGANNSLPSVPTPPSGIKPPYTPNVSNGVPNGLVAQATNTIIDPSLRTPYSIGINFGVQHELPAGMILKVNYAGRLGRKLLAYADGSQLIDFKDPKSGQSMSTAFASITQSVRAGANTANLAPQPWLENVLTPGYGSTKKCGTVTCANNTSYAATSQAFYVGNGDFADFMYMMAATGILPANVGLASQFGENGFVTNKGNSTYHALLATVQKNMTHGLQMDFNYTLAHSIDNTSLIANLNPANNGLGFVCDATNGEACRGNSDFDVTNYISVDFIYQLPFGKGRMFANTAPLWVNEIIGGWDVSGITSWHSGVAFTGWSDAYMAGFGNNNPAIFNGDRAAVATRAHKVAGGSVNVFENQGAATAAFRDPIGLEYGSRNNLRGPNYVSQNLGLAKAFPITQERVRLKFRADAYNIFNHASFSNPLGPLSATATFSSGTFGQITSTSTTPRVLQLAARLEF
jgi:hypothetical protein